MTSRAQTYGEALYELARDESKSAEILEELHMAASILEENPEYARLLSTPSIPVAERCGALDESFGGRVDGYLLNFMKILVEKGIIRQLSGCERAYRKRYNEDNGILEVTVVTAVPLKEALAEKLRKKLEERTGKRVDLRARVDSDIIGGVRLDMNGKCYDGSVRAELADIERSIGAVVL